MIIAMVSVHDPPVYLHLVQFLSSLESNRIWGSKQRHVESADGMATKA